MEKVKLTGSYYLKKRFFGGYDVMVEFICRHFNHHDCSYGPEFTKYIKSTEEDLLKLNILHKK